MFVYSKLTETVSAEGNPGAEQATKKPGLEGIEVFDSAENRAAMIGILTEENVDGAANVYGCGMSCSGCSPGSSGCGCTCSCSSSCIGSGFTYSHLTEDPISMELSMPDRLVAAVGVLERK